ncbi:MAG TPA: hypothetical protein V6D22_16365 [Candidatus Obscuribacterales bacterium]
MQFRCSHVVASVVIAISLTACGAIAADPNGSMMSLRSDFGIPLKRSQDIDYGINVANEHYYFYKPANYTGREPFGLMVYVPPIDDMQGLPGGWDAVLAQRKLLCLIPQRAGNDTMQNRRMGLAILGALAVMHSYNVNPRRVYAAGLSGGARTACDMGFYQSDLFRGTIQDCGADYYRPVTARYATSQTDTAGYPYGKIDVDPNDVAAAKSKVRFTLITGSGDFRHGNLLDIYSDGFQRDGFQARLFDVNGMGHQDCSPQTLTQALDFIER